MNIQVKIINLTCWYYIDCRMLKAKRALLYVTGHEQPFSEMKVSTLESTVMFRVYVGV